MNLICNSNSWFMLKCYPLYLCTLVSASAFFAISRALPSILPFIVFDFNSLGSTWSPLLLSLFKSWGVPFPWSLHQETYLAFVSASNLPHESVVCFVIAQRQGRIWSLLGPQHRSKAREDYICSSLMPQRRSRARRTYLTCAGCLHSRRDLLWVSSVCLNTLGQESRSGAHAHGEI